MVLVYIGGSTSEVALQKLQEKQQQNTIKTSDNTAALIKFLAERNSTVHLACQEDSFFNSTVSTTEIKLVNGILLPGHKETIEFNEVTSLHARRSLDPSLLQERFFPMANNSTLRSLGDKETQSNLLKDFGYIPTLVLENDEEFCGIKFSNWIEQNGLTEYNKFVVKLSQSMQGYYVSLSSFKDIRSTIQSLKNLRLSNDKPAISVLIQPFFKPDIFAVSGVQEVVELRMFCTFAQDLLSDEITVNIVQIGRNIKPLDESGEHRDKWADLSAFNLPIEISVLSREIAKIFAKESQSRIGFIAIDFIMHNGKFYVVEVNTKNPLYPSRNNIMDTSEQITANIAEILVRG